MDDRHRASTRKDRCFTAALLVLWSAMLCMITAMPAACGDGKSPSPDSSAVTTADSSPGTSLDASTNASSGPAGFASSADTTGMSQQTQPDTENGGYGMLIGEWFFPDGSGSVLIDEGPAITFVDIAGSIAGGPYEATAEGPTVSLSLSTEELVSIFGDDSGVERADLTFRQADTAGGMVMEISTNEGDQPPIVLTQSPPGTEGSDTPGSETSSVEFGQIDDPDAQMEQIAERLVEGLTAFRLAEGRLPQPDELVQGGPVDPYIPGGWPINPFTGDSIVELLSDDRGTGQPGDVLYIYGDGETWLRYWTSDGTQQQMQVDW